MNGAFPFVAGTWVARAACSSEDVATHDSARARRRVRRQTPGHDQARSDRPASRRGRSRPGSRRHHELPASGLSGEHDVLLPLRANNSATSVNRTAPVVGGDAQTDDVYFWQGPRDAGAPALQVGLDEHVLSLPKLKQGVYTRGRLWQEHGGVDPGPVWSFTTRTKTTGSRG